MTLNMDQNAEELAEQTDTVVRCSHCRWYEAIGTGRYPHGGCLIGEPCRFDECDKDRPHADFPAYRYPIRLPTGTCAAGELQPPGETWGETRAALQQRMDGK